MRRHDRNRRRSQEGRNTCPRAIRPSTSALKRLVARDSRLHQWSKNVLIFVPLFVGHVYADPAKIAAVTIGFVLLCALSSATYVLNDLADLQADRAHATKRLRPFASGDLKIAPWPDRGAARDLLRVGRRLSVICPFFLRAFSLISWLTSAYSLGLKRIPLFDVFVISALFTLRIVMGAEVVGLGHSPWLLSFSRLLPVAGAGQTPRRGYARGAHRVEEIAGRGYRGNDWPVTLIFGVGAGLVSVVIMLLYMTNDAAPSGFYSQPVGSTQSGPADGLADAHLALEPSYGLHDDPVVFALRDRVSLRSDWRSRSRFTWLSSGLRPTTRNCLPRIRQTSGT